MVDFPFPASQLTRRNDLRLREGQPFTKFSARIPKADRDEFHVLLPQHGSRMWFIRQSLARLLDNVEKNPSVIPEITASIQSMLSAETDSSLGGVEFPASVHSQDYRRFNEVFGMYGATSWFVRGVVREYLKLAKDLPSIEKQVNDAVDNLLVAAA